MLSAIEAAGFRPCAVTGRTILDDGVRQEVALFGSVQVPLDMVLVFDTSSSMAAALPAVKSGARGLLSSPRDTMNGRSPNSPTPRGSSGPTAAVPRAAPATGLAAAVQQRALCAFSHIVGGSSRGHIDTIAALGATSRGHSVAARAVLSR
jgi:hypothetical protein